MPDDRDHRVDITPLERPLLGGDVSPLAIDLPEELAPRGFDPRKRPGRQRERVDQYIVHMTGSGIVLKEIGVNRALDEGEDPVRRCLRYYANKRGRDGKPRSSSHYLIGYDGEIYWLTGERIRVFHVGVYAPERAAYASGAWRRGISVQTKEGIEGPIRERAVVQWDAAWPGHESPLDLALGGGLVNDHSVASEMPPAGFPLGGGRFEPLAGLNIRPGTWHTEEQHFAVARLAVDLARRWAWPQDWAQRSSRRVTGHEDHDLFGRADGGGGWDPGALRAAPRWDWPHVFNLIQDALEL